MIHSINLVMAGSTLEFNVCLFEAKNRVFEYGYQKMNTFEFVQCSKNDVRVCSMFDKMVFDTSLAVMEGNTKSSIIRSLVELLLKYQ